MNRKRIALVGMAVFVFLIVLVTVLSFTKKSSADICKGFIMATVADNTEKSYAMFSSAAKAQTSLSAWQQSARNVSIAYGTNVRLQQLSDAETPASKEQPYDGAITFQATGQEGVYDATCHIVKDKDGYFVDSFSSDFAQR